MLCVCWYFIKVVSNLKFSFKLMFWRYSLSSEQIGQQVTLLPFLHDADLTHCFFLEHIWSILFLFVFLFGELWHWYKFPMQKARPSSELWLILRENSVTAFQPKLAFTLLPVSWKAYVPQSIIFNKFQFSLLGFRWRELQPQWSVNYDTLEIRRFYLRKV